MTKEYTVTIEMSADSIDEVLLELKELFLSSPEDPDGIWRFVKTRVNDMGIESEDDE